MTDDDYTPFLVSVPTDAHFCTTEASAALRFRKVPCLSLRRVPFKKLSGKQPKTAATRKVANKKEKK